MAGTEKRRLKTMADDNDKPTLTRRRVLGGMATIGAAGAVGAGTWAQYSSEETIPVEAEAGTMDLEVKSSVSIPTTVGPLAPGETFSKEFNFRNTGNVDANALGLTLSQVSSGEGDNTDDETDTGGNGELDEQLEVRANKKGQHYFGSSSSYEDYNSVKGTEHSVTGAFSAGDSIPTTIEGRFKDISNNNAAQGDTLTFDTVFVLYQNSAP
jgi:spore coat-associated protein N